MKTATLIPVVLLAVALSLGLVACDRGGEAPAPAPPPPEPVLPTPDPVAVDLGAHGAASLLPIPPGPDEGLRGRRRMDIDQLDASIQRVTGGIAWTEDGDPDDNLFEELASTLGKPDFIDSTQEDLTVSLLFQKFLGDAARSVCTELVQRELETPSSERVLLRYVDEETTPLEDAGAVQANLRYLLLRYHSELIPEGDPRVNPWSWLFESALHVNGGDVPAAWRTVCVALITHPDFYSY